MADAKPLIIVGASTRAAAQSAVRCGYAPWCIDQFGDSDLREIADYVEVVLDWPDGIPGALRNAPPGQLVYAGALENSPELLDGLHDSPIHVAGICGRSLRLVRDPVWLQSQLADAGLPSLAVRRDLTPADRTTRWLRKPLESAAGFHIREAVPPASAQSDTVYQQRVDGESVSGLYLADGETARLLGMCRQLHGESDAGASGFLHCGSIGPLTLEDLPEETFWLARSIGQQIAARAQLAGVFGIDFIASNDGRTLWCIELNPRWTASAEIIERARNWPLMSWHIQAAISEFHGGSTSVASLPIDAETRPAVADRVSSWGRLIVYSPCAVTITRELTDLETIASDQQMEVADRPTTGTKIDPGHPLCTLITVSETVEACRQKLLATARSLRCELAN